MEYLYGWFLGLTSNQLRKLSLRISPDPNDHFIATHTYDDDMTIPVNGYVIMRRETAVDSIGREFYVYNRYDYDNYWVLNG